MEYLQMNMGTSATTAAPRLSCRARAALAAVAGIVVLAVGISVFIRLPGVPYNVPQVFPAQHRHLCIAIFAVLLLVMGLTPAAVAAWIVRQPRHALWTPLVTVGATLAAWAMLRASVTTERIHKILGYPVLHWGWDWELICRFLALYGGVMMILILAAVVVAARHITAGSLIAGEAGRRAAGRMGRSASGLVAGMILFCLPWLVLARLVVIDWADTDNLTELIRTEPYPGDVFLTLVVLLIGLNAAVLAHVFLDFRPGRAVLAVAGTIALAVPGWFLLELGLMPSLPKYGITFSAAQFLLGPNRTDALSAANLALRWSVVQIAAVLVLAYGEWIALRLLHPASASAAEDRPAGATASESHRADLSPSARADLRATTTVDSSGEPLTGLAAPGRVYWLLSILYVTFVIYGSLVPLDFASVPLDQAWNRFTHAQYLAITAGGRADMVANLLLFIPLTFFFMGALTREDRRRPRWAIAAILAALAVALAVSIEFTQVFFPPRTVSLNDMMNESIGGAIGIAAWMLFGGRVSRWVRGMWGERVHHALAVKILIAYTFLMVAYQLLPYDLTIRPVELWEKYKGTRITLVPFTDKLGLDLYMVWIKLAIMIPVGLLMAQVVRPGRRSLMKAAGLGLLVAAGIEVAQLFVMSRYSSTTDVILGTLGAAVGVWLADRVGPLARHPLAQTPLWRRHGRRVLGAAAVAAVAAYFCLKWRAHVAWPPIRFVWPAEGPVGRLTDFVHVPLFYQYFNTEFSAAAQLLRDAAGPFIVAMLFMSVLGGRGRWGRTIAAIAAAAIGFAGEMGRIFLVPAEGHTLVIDPVTAVVAAASGVAGVLVYDRFVELFVRTPPREEESDAGVLST